MASVVTFLESNLRLKVNQAKSAVAPVVERLFLGHRLLPGGRLGVAPKSLNRAKERLRGITRRNRGIALERMIAEVNSFTTGWVTYFRHAACQEALRETDEWLGRKLRWVRLKQLQTGQGHRRLPHELGRASTQRLATGRLGQGMVVSVRKP